MAFLTGKHCFAFTISLKSDSAVSSFVGGLVTTPGVEIWRRPWPTSNGKMVTRQKTSLPASEHSLNSLRRIGVSGSVGFVPGSSPPVLSSRVLSRQELFHIPKIEGSTATAQLKIAGPEEILPPGSSSMTQTQTAIALTAPCLMEGSAGMVSNIKVFQPGQGSVTRLEALEKPAAIRPLIASQSLRSIKAVDDLQNLEHSEQGSVRGSDESRTPEQSPSVRQSLAEEEPATSTHSGVPVFVMLPLATVSQT